jgi:hypothetical protein
VHPQPRGLRRFPFGQRAVNIGNLDALGYAEGFQDLDLVVLLLNMGRDGNSRYDVVLF